MTLFDIKREKEVIARGGFWCHGCLVSQPASEQSSDSRYCHGCFKFLSDGALLIEKHKKPGWAPVPIPSEALPAMKEDVTKLPIHENLHPQETGGVLLQKNKGGRPRKPEGEPISRMTKHRRANQQGVLAL